MPQTRPRFFFREQTAKRPYPARIGQELPILEIDGADLEIVPEILHLLDHPLGGLAPPLGRHHGLEAEQAAGRAAPGGEHGHERLGQGLLRVLVAGQGQLIVGRDGVVAQVVVEIAGQALAALALVHPGQAPDLHQVLPGVQSLDQFHQGPLRLAPDQVVGLGLGQGPGRGGRAVGAQEDHRPVPLGLDQADQLPGRGDVDVRVLPAVALGRGQDHHPGVELPDQFGGLGDGKVQHGRVDQPGRVPGLFQPGRGRGQAQGRPGAVGVDVGVGLVVVRDHQGVDQQQVRVRLLLSQAAVVIQTAPAEPGRDHARYPTYSGLLPIIGQIDQFQDLEPFPARDRGFLAQAHRFEELGPAGPGRLVVPAGQGPPHLAPETVGHGPQEFVFQIVAEKVLGLQADGVPDQVHAVEDHAAPGSVGGPADRQGLAHGHAGVEIGPVPGLEGDPQPGRGLALHGALAHRELRVHAFHRAQPPGQQVQVVDHLVHQDPAAVSVHGGFPVFAVAEVVVPGGVVDGHLHLDGPGAEPALVDEPLQIGMLGRVALVVEHAQGHALGLRLLDQFPALRQRNGQGFFHQHGQPGLDGQPGQGNMAVMDRAHVHALDQAQGQEVGHVAHRLQAPFAGEFSRCVPGLGRKHGLSWRNPGPRDGPTGTRPRARRRSPPVPQSRTFSSSAILAHHLLVKLGQTISGGRPGHPLGPGPGRPAHLLPAVRVGQQGLHGLGQAVHVSGRDQKALHPLVDGLRGPAFRGPDGGPAVKPGLQIGQPEALKGVVVRHRGQDVEQALFVKPAQNLLADGPGKVDPVRQSRFGHLFGEPAAVLSSS